MAAKRKTRRGPQAGPEGVKRRPAGSPKKGLAPEFEGLASGEEKRPRFQRKFKPRLKDPRVQALVPGVANRDARMVFAKRVEAFNAAEGDLRAELMAEAMMLRLWRCRSVMSLAAFADDVLGIAPEEAQELGAKGAEILGVSTKPWTDPAVACWLRAEAALVDGELEARVRPLPGTNEQIAVHLDALKGPEILHAIGRRMTPLVKDRTEGHRPGTQDERPGDRSPRDGKGREGRFSRDDRGRGERPRRKPFKGRPKRDRHED